MPQKPIDKRRPDQTRETIWAEIRKTKGRPFSFREIWEVTTCSRDTVREYITALVAAGYVQKLSPLDTPATPYKLVKDNGIEAPRVRRDGTEITQGRGREQMWRTMRILTEFSPKDLAIHAATDNMPISEVDAKNYVYHLHKAGYLAMIATGKPGSVHTAGSQARYRFLSSKYTGPKPPMVQRVKQVYDPNTGKVVWSGGANDAE